ncbi:hypothetical protein ACHAXH_002377 [Discostella pseudostelligera]
MSCKEVIQFIMKLTSATKKTCENHFDWMIKNKHFPELKNFGRVQKAQAATTKCACIRALNWDETCVMACITTGNLYIVGLVAAVRKHEKTTNDNKESITIV